jgi:hypothetical protein
LQIIWEVIKGTPSLARPLKNEVIKKGDQISTTWVIPAFTFPPQSQYTFRISALSLENPNIASDVSFDITILISNLLTIIKGGNRNAGFSAEV